VKIIIKTRKQKVGQSQKYKFLLSKRKQQTPILKSLMHVTISVSQHLA